MQFFYDSVTHKYFRLRPKGVWRRGTNIENVSHEENLRIWSNIRGWVAVFQVHKFHIIPHYETFRNNYICIYWGKKKKSCKLCFKWKKSKAAKSNIDSRMIFMMNKATIVYMCQCVRVICICKHLTDKLLEAARHNWLWPLEREMNGRRKPRSWRPYLLFL